MDCNAGGSINAALAPLDLQGPHTITVTGVCQEAVNIMNRERVTIQAPAGQTATIRQPAGGGSPAAVTVNGSSGISLQRLVLTGSASGLFLQRLSDADRTAASSGSSGAPSSRAMAWPGWRSSITRRCRFLNSFVRRNGQQGVVVLNSSTISLGNSTIENNAWAGVLIGLTSHASIDRNTISGNGGGPGAVFTGGLVVSDSSVAVVGGDSTITNNTGPGVLATANATLFIDAGNTVGGNSEQRARCEAGAAGRGKVPRRQYDRVERGGGPRVQLDFTRRWRSKRSAAHPVRQNRARARTAATGCLRSKASWATL